MPDEPVYSQLARGLASNGHFTVAGSAYSPWSFGPLYPILIAPIYWAIGSLAHAYFVVKAVNSLMFCSAAIPAYLLANRILDRKRALIAAGLAVLVPSGIYTTKIMTESLAYPLFLFAVLSIVVLLEKPTRRRELLALIAIVTASLARGQLIVLLPALVSAALVVEALERPWESSRGRIRFAAQQLRAYPIMWLVVVSGALAFGAAAVFQLSTSWLVGNHTPASAGIEPIRMAESFVLHIAALDLYVGVIPFAALALMASICLKRGTPRETRIVCTVAISASCWLALAAAKYLVAAYPGSFFRIYDRYVFYAVPLILIAFLVWLRDGMPRPRSTFPIALGAAALPLMIPFSDVLSGGEWGVSSSSVALVPWANLRFLFGTPLFVYPTLLVTVIALARVFIRSRDADWQIFLVAANFVVVSIFVLWGNSAVAHQALREGVGARGSRSWIDSAVGPHARVDVLWAGSRRAPVGDRYAIWESEFFNRSVRRIYWLQHPIYQGYPGDQLQLREGSLYRLSGRRFPGRYVVAAARIRLEGRRIAANEGAGLVLYDMTHG